MTFDQAIAGLITEASDQMGSLRATFSLDGSTMPKATRDRSATIQLRHNETGRTSPQSFYVGAADVETAADRADTAKRLGAWIEEMIGSIVLHAPTDDKPGQDALGRMIPARNDRRTAPAPDAALR